MWTQKLPLYNLHLSNVHTTQNATDENWKDRYHLRENYRAQSPPSCESVNYNVRTALRADSVSVQLMCGTPVSCLCLVQRSPQDRHFLRKRDMRLEAPSPQCPHHSFSHRPTCQFAHNTNVKASPLDHFFQSPMKGQKNRKDQKEMIRKWSQLTFSH